MSAARTLDLVFDPAPLAIVRLAPDAPLPAWAQLDAPFASVTRTPDELSIVVPAARVPAGEARVEGPFVSFRVRGLLDFEQVGVLAALAGPLAAAGIPIFALATFDTDWVLVPAGAAQRAADALRAAGHALEGD
jgi:uncharacterized protein